MLNLIGIGLGDIRDITLRAEKLLKESDKIYLESYTSFYGSSKEEIESFLGKEIIIAPRNTIEDNKELIEEAKKMNVSIMIIGDVFAATTHVELYQRAIDEDIKVNIIHNASIMTAVGIVGLELYKYGKTTSIPFKEENYFPTTPYDVIFNNKKMGLHTLILLDLRPLEKRFMPVNDALKLLLEMEDIKKNNLINNDTKVIGCARLGRDDFKIKYGKIKDIIKEDFGFAPHCIIIPGKLHFIEEEMLNKYTTENKT